MRSDPQPTPPSMTPSNPCPLPSSPPAQRPFVSPSPPLFVTLSLRLSLSYPPTASIAFSHASLPALFRQPEPAAARPSLPPLHARPTRPSPFLLSFSSSTLFAPRRRRARPRLHLLVSQSPVRLSSLLFPTLERNGRSAPAPPRLLHSLPPLLSLPPALPSRPPPPPPASSSAAPASSSFPLLLPSVHTARVPPAWYRGRLCAAVPWTRASSSPPSDVTPCLERGTSRRPPPLRPRLSAPRASRILPPVRLARRVSFAAP